MVAGGVLDLHLTSPLSDRSELTPVSPLPTGPLSLSLSGGGHTQWPWSSSGGCLRPRGDTDLQKAQRHDSWRRWNSYSMHFLVLLAGRSTSDMGCGSRYLNFHELPSITTLPSLSTHSPTRAPPSLQQGPCSSLPHEVLTFLCPRGDMDLPESIAPNTQHRTS